MENQKERSVSRTFALWVKTLACLLSVLLVLYAVPTTVYAELIETLDLSSDDIPEESSVGDDVQTVDSEKAVFEVTDRREETVKHFRTEDGSFTAVQYNMPVHEKDENGEWQDIDNTLSESGSEYATSNARVKFAKKTTGNQTLFTLHDGNRKITMSLSGANKKVTGQVTNTQTEFSEDATQLQKLMTLDKLSSKILYPDILEGVDLEYVVNSGHIKENIIVKERADAYSYTFEIQLNNLEAVLCEDGSVALQDPATDEVVYTIPKGYMFDAIGAYSDAVAYTLTNGGNGKYTLTVTADAEWINDGGRDFPVTVDPTLYDPLAWDAIDAEFTSNGRKNSEAVIPVGQGSYLYWQSPIPSLPTDAHLVAAYLSYKSQRHSGDRVGAYISSSSWIDRTQGTPTLYSDARIDYQQNQTTESEYWYTWDITQAVDAWYEGAPNYGVWLMNEESAPDIAAFYSYNCSDATSCPVFIIRYCIISGVESYWSYSTQNAGLAGTGAVNYATGELTFAVGTMTTGDALFGYTPSLIYSSNKANKYDIFTDDQDRLFKVSSKAYGWHLSTDETVSWKTDEAITDSHYVLTDSDGSKHYFLKQGSNYYRDEDGLDLVLYRHETQAQIHIVDSSNNYRYYTIYPAAEKTAPDAVLTSYKDAYGNELIFTRNAVNANIQQISVLPVGHTTHIPYFTFLYEGDQLIGVENSTRGRSVTFVYADNPDGEIEEGTKYLREIVYSHKSGNTTVEDAKVSYTYSNLFGDSEAGDVYRLATATDEKSGYRLEYLYDSAGRVCEISEHGLADDTSVEGKAIRLTYENASTVVTASGSDNVFGTDDDISTYYIFDAFGRVINSYSADKGIDEGDPTIYGAVSGVYENNEENPNRIKSSVVANNITSTLLVNGDFHMETAADNDVPYWTMSSSERMMFSFDNDSSKRGIVNFYPVRLQLDMLSQTVRLTEGEYTLSAYYETMSCSDTNIYLQVRNAETNALIYQKPLSVSDDIVEKNFDLYTFSIDPPGDATSADYKICFAVGGKPDVSENACVSLDKLMLERGIGVGYFDLISAGKFESVVLNTESQTSNDYHPVSDFWTLSPNDAGIIENGTLKLSAHNSMHTSNKAMQTVYTYTQTDLSSYYTGSAINGPKGYYIISGFGKNEHAYPNSSDSFSIGVEIDYYNRFSGITETVKHTFPFYHGYDGWQYVQGSVEIDPNRFIMEIRAVCENSYDFGEAYFDNISMYKVTDGSIVENEYYTVSDATTPGLDAGCVVGQLKLKKTPMKAEAYMYRSNPLRISDQMDTDGNYYRYEYNTAGSQTAAWYEKYDTDPNMSRAFFAVRNRVGYTELLETTCTTYEYNAYGLKSAMSVQNVTYDANDDPVYSLPLKHTITYNCQAGSQYFGSVSSETDVDGNVIQYYYDTYGRLNYTTMGGYEGLYYYYNDLDQITSVYPLAYDMNFGYFYASSYGEMVTYDYHADGSLCEVNTRTTEYTFEYDAFGNKTSVSIEGVPLSTYEYYPNNGLVKKMTYATGISVENTYDKLDRLAEVCYTDSDDEIIRHYRYHYTKGGAIARVDDLLTGESTVYQYNTSGALTEIIQVNVGKRVTSFFEYTYNEDNALSTAEYNYEYAVGDATDTGLLYYAYGYDESDRLVRYNIHGSGAEANGYIDYVYDGLGRTTHRTTNFPGFTSQAVYTFADKNNQYTTTHVNSYTSTVNDVVTNAYTYKYDVTGNIYLITDSAGEKIKYTYDDQNQLTREDNQPQKKTFVYTYDYAGNRTSKKTYTYTTGSVTGLSYTEIKYEYTNDWGDQLTKVGSTSIAYDALGNPTTYNGYALTWEGRKLMEMSMAGGQFRYTFEYNDDGIRTAKYSNGTWHYYTLEGSRIVTESIGSKLLVYLYDESGSPIGLQYRQSSYATNQYDTFFFEKNIFGDIVAIYNEDGDKIGSYTYDAWGICTTTTESGITVTERSIVRTYNPFRYRGYYYDTETGLYYLQSRYYNPQWGRFLNADGYISTGTGLLGYNMYAYCNNNPVMNVDPTGNLPGWAIALLVVAGVVVVIGVDYLIYYSSTEGYAVFEDDDDGDDVTSKAIYIKGGGFVIDSNGIEVCDLDLGLFKLTANNGCGGSAGLELCTGQASAGVDLSGDFSAEATARAAVFSTTFEQNIGIGLWDITISERIGFIGAGVGAEIDPNSGRFEITPPSAGWIVPSFSVDFDYAHN